VHDSITDLSGGVVRLKTGSTLVEETVVEVMGSPLCIYQQQHENIHTMHASIQAICTHANIERA
jgi:hypothetical protein